MFKTLLVTSAIAMFVGAGLARASSSDTDYDYGRIVAKGGDVITLADGRSFEITPLAHAPRLRVGEMVHVEFDGNGDVIDVTVG